jgi:GT2 family glycosyltransferase
MVHTRNVPVSVSMAAPDCRQLPELTEANPPVSVIIPVSRPEQAGPTLASLLRQRYGGEMEIIVAGPAASDLARHWPVVPVTYTRTARDPHEAETSGTVFFGDGHVISQARNLAALRARGAVLLFLDDDCIVAEDWVERNVRALQEPGIGAVGARVRSPALAAQPATSGRWRVRTRTFFARCTDFTNFGYYQHGHRMDQPVAGASMGVLRTAFAAVGGFDISLCTSEDMDLSFRLQKHGYRTVYCPDIVVWHDHHRDTLGKFLHYNYTRGLAAGLTTKIAHRDRGLKNRLLSSVRFPPLFLLLLPFIATAATASIVALNLGENWDVLLYAPFILLGKLTYEFAVFRQLIAPVSAKEES